MDWRDLDKRIDIFRYYNYDLNFLKNTPKIFYNRIEGRIRDRVSSVGHLLLFIVTEVNRTTPWNSFSEDRKRPG